MFAKYLLKEAFYVNKLYPQINGLNLFWYGGDILINSE